MRTAIPLPIKAIALGLAAGTLLFAAGASRAQQQSQAGDAPRHPFASVDADRSGSLSRREVIAKLPGLAAGFDIADTTGDGRLDRMEYDAAMALGASMYGQGEHSAGKREIFRTLDLDGDRAVSKDEARWRPEIAANFAVADRDGDGKLGVSEFGLISLFTLAAYGGSAQSKPVDLPRLYSDGLSARELIDAPVRGEDGERIGDVKDIVVNEHGNIAGLIVEVGGVFELADQHIGVPWKDLTFGEDMQFVQVPLKEVESGTYALGGHVPQGESVPVALTSWRVNELIGDYAAIDGAPRHGIVTDVIFNSRGQLQAVLVDRLGQRGLWAYPYTGYYPGAYAYFNKTVIALEPFDYGELGSNSRYAGNGAATGG